VDLAMTIGASMNNKENCGPARIMCLPAILRCGSRKDESLRSKVCLSARLELLISTAVGREKAREK